MATTTTSSSSSSATPLITSSSSSSSIPSSSLSSSSSSGKRGGVPFHHRPSFPAPVRATNTAASGKENATAVIPPGSVLIEVVQDRANRSVEIDKRKKYTGGPKIFYYYHYYYQILPPPPPTQRLLYLFSPPTNKNLPQTAFDAKTKKPAPRLTACGVYGLLRICHADCSCVMSCLCVC